MVEENNKQNEDHPNPPRWLVSEDAAQLQALVNQSRGIKTEPPVKEDLPDPESIDPISVEQIKVMRKSVFDTKTDKVLPARRLYETLIRAFCEIVEFSKPSNRAKRCLIDGHQCLYCGKKLPGAFSVTAEASSSPTEQPKTTPGKPEKQ